MGRNGLRQQQRCQHIDCVDSVEFCLVNGPELGVVQLLIRRDPGIVDENVDLESTSRVVGVEEVLCGLEDLWRCHRGML